MAEPFERDIRNHPLVRTFLHTNQADLANPDPDIELMKRVFAWISNEGECVTGEPSKRLDAIQVLSKIRFWTERHFSNFTNLCIETRRESKKVGKDLRKDEDNMSSWHSRYKFHFGPVGAEGEREKRGPPDSF